MPPKSTLLLLIFAMCISTTPLLSQELTNSTGKTVVKSLYSPTHADWDMIVSPQLVPFLEVMNFPGDEELVRDEDLAKLRAFKGLKTLVVGCPNVTDNGIKVFAELKTLEALILIEGKITDDGIQHLRDLPKLRTLGIFGTQVSSKGTEKLRSTLKNSYIELWGSGEDYKIFDSNGCLTTKFRTEHLGLILEPK